MHGWLGAASFFFELGTSLYQSCDEFPTVINETFPALLVSVFLQHLIDCSYYHLTLLRAFYTPHSLSTLPKLQRALTPHLVAQIFFVQQLRGVVL